MSGPAWIVLGGLVLLYVLRTISTYARLQQFRGPRWTGISNWPHSIAMLRGNCHEWYEAVNKKYGKSRLPGTSCTLHSDQDAMSRLIANVLNLGQARSLVSRLGC